MANTTTPKPYRKVYQHLYTILLIATILLGITLAIFYDDRFIQKNLGDIPNSAIDIDNEIRDYLTGKRDTLETGFLNEKEKTHLLDVKNLVSLGKILLVLMAIALIAAYKKADYKKVSKLLPYYVTGLFLALFLLSSKFDYLFDLFHKMLFRNDLWMMGPDDKIILLYPQSFFNKMATAIIVRTITLSALISIVGQLISRKYGKKKKSHKKKDNLPLSSNK